MLGAPNAVLLLPVVVLSKQPDSPLAACRDSRAAGGAGSGPAPPCSPPATCSSRGRGARMARLSCAARQGSFSWAVCLQCNNTMICSCSPFLFFFFCQGSAANSQRLPSANDWEGASTNSHWARGSSNARMHVCTCMHMDNPIKIHPHTRTREHSRTQPHPLDAQDAVRRPSTVTHPLTLTLTKP